MQSSNVAAVSSRECGPDRPVILKPSDLYDPFLNRSVFSCPGWMGRRGRGNFVLKNCRSSFKFPPSFLSNRSSLYIFIKVETIERILLFLLFLKTPAPRSFQSCRNRFDPRIENLENLPLQRGGRSRPIKISD